MYLYTVLYCTSVLIMYVWYIMCTVFQVLLMNLLSHHLTSFLQFCIFYVYAIIPLMLKLFLAGENPHF